MAFVLDSSVALAWLLPDEANERTDALADRLEQPTSASRNRITRVISFLADTANPKSITCITFSGTSRWRRDSPRIIRMRGCTS